MDDDVMAAVMTAIDAYVQEEAMEKEYVESNGEIPRSDLGVSPWRLFGRQRSVTIRTNWVVNKAGR